MRSWRPVLRNRSRWPLLFLLWPLLEWFSTPAVEARPRHRQRPRHSQRHHQRHESARPERPPQRVEASPLRSCEVWPPRSFPSIADIYALKLEYDCRNRAIAHRRYGLASQEARQSAALAEKQDRRGIEDKNRWAEKEQSDIESRQRELDEWRDQVVKRLQTVGQDSGADRSQTEPGVLANRQ